MMGGECNYLLRVGPAPQRRLEFVPDGLWKSDYMMGWRQSDIDAVLDEAGSLLQSTAAHLRLPVQARLRWSPTQCIRRDTSDCHNSCYVPGLWHAMFLKSACGAPACMLIREVMTSTRNSQL